MATGVRCFCSILLCRNLVYIAHAYVCVLDCEHVYVCAVIPMSSQYHIFEFVLLIQPAGSGPFCGHRLTGRLNY